MIPRVKKEYPQIPFGRINLAGKEGSLYKKSLICRSGLWEGMYGKVDVTEDLLRRLAFRYNKQRENPINQNDYAPILKNHVRDVDGVLGRLMADLTVDPFEDPETGEPGYGLFGTMRIDDPEAQKKVDSGQYSTDSLSFDEETAEIFELSFVAVEAARRSQVLNRGEKPMSVELQKQLDAANAKHTALATKLGSQKLARKETILAMASVVSLSHAALSSFEGSVKEISLQIRGVALTAQLRGYIREGKMTKAEFDAIKVKDLAAMDPTGAKMVLASYEGRKPSADIVQHGQNGAKPVDLTHVSPAEMRLMMEAQKTGKPYAPSGAALAADDGKPAGEKKEPGEGGDKGKEGDSEMKFSDVEDTLKKLNECLPSVSKLREHLKSMDEAIGKMKGADEEDAA